MANPFAALDFDSDDEAQVPVAEKKQPSKKKNNNNAKKKPEAKAKKAAPAAQQENADLKSYKGRGGKTYVGGRDRRGKREFDRHSGQRNRDVARKDGAGGHNWGKPGEEAEVTEYAEEGAAAAGEGNPEGGYGYGGAYLSRLFWDGFGFGFGWR